jgi:hypothetical protein
MVGLVCLVLITLFALFARRAVESPIAKSEQVLVVAGNLKSSPPEPKSRMYLSLENHVRESSLQIRIFNFSQSHNLHSR